MSWPAYILFGTVAIAWVWKHWKIRRAFGPGPASVRAARSVLRHEHPGCSIIASKRHRQGDRQIVGFHALDEVGRSIARFYEVDRGTLRVRPIDDPGELPDGWPPAGWR